MFYLILAVVSSALVSVVMRVSEDHIQNKISMLAMNYVMCIGLATAHTGISELFVSDSGVGTAVGLGVLNGFLYLAGFVLLQLNVEKNGVVLSATFMKLGVLVPTLISVVFFGEVPTALQIVGFLTALSAVIAIQFEKGESEVSFRTGLILLLLAGGSGDAMSKVYEELGDSSFEEHFLFVTFVAALVLCILLALKEKQHLAKEDVFWGLFIGIPNYYSARFLLKALGHVPAVVAYPTYSVASVVLVSLVGVMIFGEKLTRRRKIAVVMILAALAFLNM